MHAQRLRCAGVPSIGEKRNSGGQARFKRVTNTQYVTKCFIAKPAFARPAAVSRRSVTSGNTTSTAVAPGRANRRATMLEIRASHPILGIAQAAAAYALRVSICLSARPLADRRTGARGPVRPPCGVQPGANHEPSFLYLRSAAGGRPPTTTRRPRRHGSPRSRRSSR